MDHWNDDMETEGYEENQEHWNSQYHEDERMEDRSYQGYGRQWEFQPHDDISSERMLTMDEFYEAQRLMREWVARISQQQCDSQPYYNDEKYHWSVNQGSGSYEQAYDPYYGEPVERETSLDHENYQGHEGHWSSDQYQDSHSEIMEILKQMKKDMDHDRAIWRAKIEKYEQEKGSRFYEMEEDLNLTPNPTLKDSLSSNNEDEESFPQPITDLEKENFKLEGEVFFEEVPLVEKVFLKEHWVKVACFAQGEDEKLHEACERFTNLTLQYPNHGFKRERLLELFYIRMPQDAQRAMDDYAGGNFIDLNPTVQAEVVQHMAMESRSNWGTHHDLAKLEEVHTISLKDNSLGDESIVDNLSDELDEINPSVVANEDGLASLNKEAMLVMPLPPPKPPDEKMKMLNFSMGDSKPRPPLPKLNFDERNGKKMVDVSQFSLEEECENGTQGSLIMCPLEKVSFAWKRRRKKKERSRPLKPTYCKKPSHKSPKLNQRLGEKVIKEIERMYKEVYKDKFHVIHRLSRDPSKGLLKCASY